MFNFNPRREDKIPGFHACVHYSEVPLYTGCRQDAVHTVATNASVLCTQQYCVLSLQAEDDGDERDVRVSLPPRTLSPQLLSRNDRRRPFLRSQPLVQTYRTVCVLQLLCLLCFWQLYVRLLHTLVWGAKSLEINGIDLSLIPPPPRL